MSETEFTLLLWGLLIAFIVGRNYYKKYQAKEKEEKYLKTVKTLRKMMLASNDSEFSNASIEMNNQINKKNKLYFKSVDAAFEYMEKFFSNYQIEKKSLYHGKITFLNKKKDTAHVKVLCLINNKTDYAVVTAVKSDSLKKDLKNGDFVYVGIEDVGQVVPWKKTFSKSGMESILLNQNSKGVIVKKLTLGLNITSSMFEFDE